MVGIYIIYWVYREFYLFYYILEIFIIIIIIIIIYYYINQVRVNQVTIYIIYNTNTNTIYYSNIVTYE